jgi:hypothetical protein
MTLSSGKNVPSWTQSIQLAPISGLATSSIDWAKLSRFLPEEGDGIQSPKRCVLNKKQGDI